MKLALVLDKSQTYIDLQKDKLYADWELEPADIKKISGIREAGKATLFGGIPASLLTLDDAAAVKQFVIEFEEISKKDKLAKSVGRGLIIQSQVSRNSTRKLEKLITDLNGEVIFSKVDSKSTMGAASRLIADFGFSREVREYMLNHVGQDYEALIPIVRSFSDIPKSEHRKIGLEEIYIRLPQAEGSIPPWEIEKPLLNGDTTEMIRMFRRIHQNTDLLLVLAILKNKLQLSYRIAAIKETSPSLTQTEISEYLGVPDKYPLKLAMQNARSIGFMRLQKGVEMLADLETKVKGGAATAGDVTMEVTLVELQRILRGQ